MTKDDSISRQAAIDAMCELMHHWFGGDPKDEVREIKRELEKLPAVQPQPVVRCKDCRYQDKGCNESESWNLCGYRPWLHVPTEDEHYCGYAEKRTNE